MRIMLSLFMFMSCLFLISCSAGVTRSGYKFQDIQAFHDFSGCRVVIKNNADFTTDEVTIVGNIKVFDTQFSVECDEEYVLDLLTKEACALGADIVNIIEEKQPNIWSTCYRAKAQYLRVNNRQRALILKSDPQYEWSIVQQRGAKGRQRTNEAVSGSIMGGAIGGAAAGQ